jgi:hypothetical protein
MGAIIVNGMVYVTSGYIGFQNGQPGNLLLAFGPPNRQLRMLHATGKTAKA